MPVALGAIFIKEVVGASLHFWRQAATLFFYRSIRRRRDSACGDVGSRKTELVVSRTANCHFFAATQKLLPDGWFAE
ncbi:hypothetical protein [Blastopirellula marina]|uniref:Uncharacterized protein n=1 Tax=Blastopirellula marina TaxID=124 RepID=A0A2S8G7F9_9BACT|nr:hypothetical protein [Blastopirellula marina]PQO40230.1 hypothetical protein C5Y98_06405 [Blastopirellula marina]PTL45597.1 hypothetical protein C5Y97_06405 [Blastopirellula marina]